MFLIFHEIMALAFTVARKMQAHDYEVPKKLGTVIF